MSPSVLICPAHYRFEHSSGSEYQWTVELVNNLSQIGLCVSAITGVQVDQSPADVRGVWERHPTISTARRLEFLARYTAKGAQLIQNHPVDVLHHFLPFALGTTFNPLALLAPPDLPFVLGPVQTALEVDTSDERGVADRVFDDGTPAVPRLDS